MSKEINISNLSIGYNNTPILSNININDKLGQFISIIGRNGKGKSTLIKTITSLIPTINGSININNISLTNESPHNKSKLISIVLTNKLAIYNTSVYEFISFGRYPYTNWLGINKLEDNNIVKQAIQLCKLQHLENKLYSDLSDGERQKVNIARAIAQNTPLIILDEPTAHLDLVNKVEVFKLLKLLVEKHNKTIIISSHQIDLALQISDKIWLIDNNKILSETPKNLIQKGNIENLFSDTDISFNASTSSFSLK